jgi:hypothetical protein
VAVAAGGRRFEIEIAFVVHRFSYSAFAPDSLTTFAHLTDSDLM